MKATLGNYSVEISTLSELGKIVRNECYDHVQLEEEVVVSISLEYSQSKERDILKADGFKWDSLSKSWTKNTTFIPRRIAELL